MSKLIKNIAFAMMVTIVFALISTTAAFAAESGVSSGAVKSSDDSVCGVTEDNKELVLYNTDGDIDGDGTEDLWVGFRYIDEDGNAYLDITYNGKYLAELEEEGYIVEFMAYSEPDSGNSDWCKLKDLGIYNSNTIYISSSDNYNSYKFRVSSSNENIISISDKFLIKPNEITSPIIINSNLNNCDYYNLDGQSIKISLKFNDNFSIQDTSISPSIDMNIIYGNEEANMIIPFFATNLQYENHSENININGKDYTYTYSIVTFYCNFAHFEVDYYSEHSICGICYELSLKNLIGINYQTEPYNFLYTISCYKDVSLNPKKKVTIQEHDNQLDPGDSVNLTTNILSDNILKENLIWESSDENIATVDENGTVTANGYGKAYIYVTEKDTDELYDYSIINIVDNVSPHTVRNWSNRGLIKPDQVTPTGREFFSEEQIDRLVKENKKNV